jgi:hypothetical protein
LNNPGIKDCFVNSVPIRDLFEINPKGAKLKFLIA